MYILLAVGLGRIRIGIFLKQVLGTSKIHELALRSFL
jgi:hypothetical protein